MKWLFGKKRDHANDDANAGGNDNADNGKTPGGAGGAGNKKKNTGQKSESSAIINWLCIGLLVLGVAIVLLFGTSVSGKATIFQWMLACLLAGTFIGFLFGIPKILQGGQQAAQAGTNTANNAAANPGAAAGNTNTTTGITYQQQVNTNLTEISDWLTKIIVGLGLVNLTKIPPYLHAVAKILADALGIGKTTGGSSLAYAFAYGVIITYLIMGFLFGYITTRLYLAGAFLIADRKSLYLDMLSSRTDEAKAAADSANQKAEFALAKTTDAKPEDGAAPKAVDAAEHELNDLITEYNQTRGSMGRGDRRTSIMTGIVSRMTSIIPSVANFDVTIALKDTNNGRRLAGYAYLYTKPEITLIGDLVDALLSDSTPFGQYWAIQALGKILAQNPYQNISTDIYLKLKNYYDRLQDGVDRKYELGKLLPALNTK